MDLPPSVLAAVSPLQLGPLDAFLAAFCIVVVASLVVFILVAVWVYRDAESRGMSGGLWVVLLIVGSLFSFIGGLIVLIIYLIVRSEHPVGMAAYPGYPPPYAPPAYPTAPAPPPPAGPIPPPAAPSGGTCRACGAPLPPNATFCVRCGTRV